MLLLATTFAFDLCIRNPSLRQWPCPFLPARQCSSHRRFATVCPTPVPATDICAASPIMSLSLRTIPHPRSPTRFLLLLFAQCGYHIASMSSCDTLRELPTLYTGSTADLMRVMSYLYVGGPKRMRACVLCKEPSAAPSNHQVTPAA